MNQISPFLSGCVLIFSTATKTPNWKNLTTVSRIRAQRWIGEEKSSEDRYHIASITGAERLLGAVRSHGLHWTLDLAFDEVGVYALESFERKDNILGGHFVAVMKLYPFAQPELVHLLVCADCP